MSKISSLTAEQKARFPEFVQKWIDIGLCTEPADRQRAEHAIRELYRLARLRDPAIFWLPCPISGALAAVVFAHLTHGSAVGLAVGSAVNSAVHSAVSSAVNSAVGLAVGSAVHSAVNFAVGSAVNSAVRSAVHSAVRSAVDSAVHSAVSSAVNSAVNSAVGLAVGSAVRSAVNLAVHSAVSSAVNSAVHSAVRSAVNSAASLAGRSFYGGSLWPGYAAWADYFNEVVGVSIDRNYLDVVESCGYHWLLNGVCFASERPSAVHLDDRGRLHSAHGKSIYYPSDWGLYHWHGVSVPAHVIESPEKITSAQIENEQNAEVRRVMIERYGQARYLKDSGAKKVSTDEFGALWRKDLNNDEPLQMVELLNSTPEPDGSIKTYFLRVPPQIKTAHQAVAWSFGLTAKQYAPLQET